MKHRVTSGAGARRGGSGRGCGIAFAALLAALVVGAGSAQGEVAGAVATGANHACARTTDAGVLCWGSNGDGQLGNGTTTPSSVPLATSGLASGVVAITAGDRHGCALDQGGGVQCWGYNQYGQLGNATTTNSSVPVAVSGLASGVAGISLGAQHGCALSSGGGVQCWGLNSNGQLGNDATPISNVPVAVAGLASGVAAIAVGGFHSCALSLAGGVQCWGFNESGQLGNASTTDSDVPVAVVGLASGVTAIAAGAHHTCALTVGGGVQCWGLNYSGQLGNGATTNSSIPVAVSGVSIGIAAGDSHTCALTPSGGVQCWGLNGSGQLGNGSTTNSSVPVGVSGRSGGVVAIDAGGFHTCAATARGGVQCWGYNLNGQLGNATTTSSSIPVWAIAQVSEVPALGGPALGLLAAALGLVGASSSRRGREGSSIQTGRRVSKGRRECSHR